MLSACGFVDSGGSQGEPPGSAGADRTVNEQARVVLNASGVDAQTYQWRQNENSGPLVTLMNAETVKASFIAPSVTQRTELLFTLTTIDKFGAKNTDPVKITINNNPIANAGRNNSFTTGTQATLNGGASSDTDGRITAYSWRQIDGTQVVLAGANTVTPRFMAPGGQAGEVLTFRVTVTDDNGAQDTDDVSITVNFPPLADAGPPATAMGEQTARLDGTASSDPEGGTLTFQWTQTAGLPVVRLIDANSATPTFTAPDVKLPVTLTFQVLVTDNLGATDSDRVVIRIVPANTPPVAMNDGPFTLEQGGTLTVPAPGVLGNDRDADVDSLLAALVVAPRNGGVSLTSNGSFTYTHNGSETTADSFIYRANDGIANSNLAVVSITITPVNNSPDAIPDLAITTAETPVTINLTANDSDPDSAIDPTSVQVTHPGNGSIINNLNGTVTYTPNPGFPNPDSSDTDSFIYTVADISGARSTPARVTINVSATANSAPVANPDATTTNPGAPVTINVVTNDTDSDGPINPATVVITTPPASGGSATSNGDGTVTYVPPSAGLLISSDNFQYTVQDDSGALSNPATVTITINRGAPIEPTSCWTTSGAQMLKGNLKRHFDGLTEPRRYSLIRQGTKGTAKLIDPTSGAFVYTPNGVDARGSDTFTYKVENRAGKGHLGKVMVVIDARVMPLGDSITAGVMNGANQLPVPEARVGYRKDLQRELTAAGYQMDFVGSQSFGAGVPGFDYQTEAHAGRTPYEMAMGSPAKDIDYPNTGVYAWLNQNPADFVLLHVGSENLAAASVDAVETMLDEIDRWERDHHTEVRVLLARVVDHRPPDPRIAVFNDQVEAMVKDRVKNPANEAYPDQIAMVDQQAALSSATDMSDKLHPNAAGYAKMANAWFKAIRSTCRPPAKAPLK